MGAVLSCQWAHIPDLDLSRGYVVWASTSVVAVIVDVEVIAGCGRVPSVLHRCYDIELIARSHRRNGLTGIRCLLKPHTVDCEIS